MCGGESSSRGLMSGQGMSFMAERYGGGRGTKLQGPVAASFAQSQKLIP